MTAASKTRFSVRRLLGSCVLVLGLVVAGCAGETIGAGPEGAVAVLGATTTSQQDSAEVPAEPPLTAGTTAGELRGTIRMARANWSSGAMQAEIYAQLLEELGYDVDRGSEIAPEDFYAALAAGEYDFWANGWPIVHTRFFESTTPDGVIAGELMQFVGSQMRGGGLQGFLVDIPTADRLGITTLDDIVDDDAIRAEFDADGDGRAEIAGCDVGWGCEKVIDQLIADNGWEDRLVQSKGVHGELFAEQIARAEAGAPVLAYVWTPGPFIAQLTPGKDVIWLGVENPDPAQSAPADLPDEQCRMEPCTMGFSPSDIVVAANDAFLESQPAAAQLLADVRIGVLDVSFQNVEMLNGENTENDIALDAAQWISGHRSDVDRWLAAAKAAG